MNTEQQKERRDLGYQLRAEIARVADDTALVVETFQKEVREKVRTIQTSSTESVDRVRTQFNEAIETASTRFDTAQREAIEAIEAHEYRIKVKVDEQTAVLRRPFWGRMKWIWLGK